MSSTLTPSADTKFVSKLQMQHRLFSELSNMFGKEVPLYDKSLLVNKVCNKTTCAILGQLHRGFSISDEQLDKTSGERHGAIRIGTPEEYRWVAGYFAAFDLEPHNFYDMTSLGSKSQPIIATAFRSPVNPEHRVFCSLLMTDYFDPETKARVESRLSKRQVFSDRAKELIIRNETEGGLDQDSAEELVQEGINRIFKWTGQAHDFELYQDLCNNGLKIAADIACFESHHLNHLTPNTFCMDLFTSAMKHCLGELTREEMTKRATNALTYFVSIADADYMKLHFKHLSSGDIAAFEKGSISDSELQDQVRQLIDRLNEHDLNLSSLNHSGFKDFTEGPAYNIPILLRQDSYKALTEPVVFIDDDGTTHQSAHTARFGEIEQRYYATTPAGRKLYDESLVRADAARAQNAALKKQDYDAYVEVYANEFSVFPKTLSELLALGLVFGKYSVAEGCAPESLTHLESDSVSLAGLVRTGLVQYEGLRYEDFLPFSAAGIFASNLGQYGTESTAQDKPTYSQGTLETIMGKRIIDPNVVYAGLQAESVLTVYEQLKVADKLSESERQTLEEDVSRYHEVLSYNTQDPAA